MLSASSARAGKRPVANTAGWHWTCKRLGAAGAERVRFERDTGARRRVTAPGGRTRGGRSMDRNEERPAGRMLSEEDAYLLLAEARELVDSVEPGIASRDAGGADRAERLISSLRSLPAPTALGAEPMEGFESWFRLLVSEGGHEGQGAPDDVRAALHDRLAQLEDLVSRQFEG